VKVLLLLAFLALTVFNVVDATHADPKPTITHSPVYDGECLTSITNIVKMYNVLNAENAKLKAQLKMRVVVEK